MRYFGTDSNCAQFNLIIPPLPSRNIINVLPQDIFNTMFEVEGIRPMHRLAFGLTCRTARKLLIEWRRCDQSNLLLPKARRVSVEEIDSPDEELTSLDLECRAKICSGELNVNEAQLFLYKVVHAQNHNICDYLTTGNKDVTCWILRIDICDQLSEGEPWDLKEPEALGHDESWAPSMHVRLMFLAVTFLERPWLFLAVSKPRMCVGCPSIVSSLQSSVNCQELHDMPMWRVIQKFFICKEYPDCYDPCKNECQKTYIRRLQEGDIPEIGMLACRVYWQCQYDMRISTKGKESF